MPAKLSVNLNAIAMLRNRRDLPWPDVADLGRIALRAGASGLTVHPRDFRRQMLWLRRLGYRGLSMSRLGPYLRGEKQGKVVGISFDDGYRNVFQNAMPVLDELGFTATNYIVARHLDGSNFWDQPKSRRATFTCISE